MSSDIAILVLQLITGQVLREPMYYLDCYQIAIANVQVKASGSVLQRDGDPSSIWRAHCETPTSLLEALTGSHGPCDETS